MAHGIVIIDRCGILATCKKQNKNRSKNEWFQVYLQTRALLQETQNRSLDIGDIDELHINKLGFYLYDTPHGVSACEDDFLLLSLLLSLLIADQSSKNRKLMA